MIRRRPAALGATEEAQGAGSAPASSAPARSDEVNTAARSCRVFSSASMASTKRVSRSSSGRVEDDAHAGLWPRAWPASRPCPRRAPGRDGDAVLAVCGPLKPSPTANGRQIARVGRLGCRRPYSGMAQRTSATVTRRPARVTSLVPLMAIRWMPRRRAWPTSSATPGTLPSRPSTRMTTRAADNRRPTAPSSAVAGQRLQLMPFREGLGGGSWPARGAMVRSFEAGGRTICAWPAGVSTSYSSAGQVSLADMENKSVILHRRRWSR